MPDKRQIVFCPNMFNLTQKEISEVDKTLSFREIYKSLTYHPEDYARIIDGDRIVMLNDFDNIPESDSVCVKLFPSGVWDKITDAATNTWDYANDVANQYGSWKDYAYLAGAFALAGPMGAMFQISWNAFQVGARMYAKYLADKFATSPNEFPNQRPDLRGGSNQKRQNGRVGILLGKHLINPDIAGNPYISISGGSGEAGEDQFLHILFCAGYNNIEIDTTSYKIGDTPLTQQNFKDHVLTVTQSGAALAEYPTRKIPKSVGKIVEYSDYSLTEGGVSATTPTNTSSIEIFITFPQGLCRFVDGGKTGAGVYYAIEYKNTGETEWSKTIAWGYAFRACSETVRIKVEKTFDNLTSSGTDYNANRQYDIRVRRTSLDADDSDTALVDEMYFDTLQCTTGTFKDGAVATIPVITADAAKLTLLALKVKAEEAANGTLETFNFIAQSKVPVYSGSGSGSAQWTTVSASSNPAALFLYVCRDAYINKKPALDAQIDWASFESWYTFCTTKGLECNAYITNEIVLEELLSSIATTGRASWSIVDGKYSVIIDKEQTTSVQFFTPRNSWGFSAAKNFEEMPTGLRIKFIDRASGYNETEIKVYYDAEDDSNIDDYSLFGCTFYENVYKQAKYILACMYLRQEVFSFNADIEHIVCTRWDRISLSHDVPLIGLHTGRVRAVVTSGGYVTGVETDERIVFEPGKSYGVIFRDQTGTARSFQVVNPCTSENIETDDLTFTTPYLIGTYEVYADDLFMFGLFESETIDLIVTDIAPSDDLSAKITCVPYVAELYTWDSGTPPTYDPMISLPGDISRAVVTGIPVDAGLLAVGNNARIGKSNNFDSALTVVAATTFVTSLTTYIPLMPFYDSSRDKIIYLNSTTGTIYEKSINSTDEGSQLVNDAGYVFCIGYYVRCADGYICDYTGTAIIEVEAWCPQIDSTGNIYYIKVSDGCVYRYNPADSTTVKITSYALKHFWMNIVSDSYLLIQDDGTLSTSGNNELVLISTTNGAYSSTIISDIPEVREFQIYEDGVYMSLDADFNLNKITSSGSLLFIPNIYQYDAYSGNIYYLKISDDRLYKQYKNLASSKISSRPYVKTSQQAVYVTGSTTNGSNVISGISALEMAYIEIGDYIEGSGIPALAMIETIDEDNSSIILNCNATATATGVQLAVATSRLILDAATSILQGTIINEHLTADSVLAVNIKDGEIVEGKIYAGAVTEGKIGTGAVTETKISTDAVTEGKIKDSAVSGRKIADGTITTDKISDTSITEGKLGTGSVTETKIADGAVTNSKIGSSAVTTTKIYDSAVTTIKINDSAVTTVKINDSAITTVKINDGAVTVDKIGSNAVTQAKMADNSVGTAEIIDLNVTSAKIASGAVNGEKIADGAVTTAKINNFLSLTHAIFDNMHDNTNNTISEFTVASTDTNPYIENYGFAILKTTSAVTLTVYADESRTVAMALIGYSLGCLLLPGKMWLEKGKSCTVSIMKLWGSELTYYDKEPK